MDRYETDTEILLKISRKSRLPMEDIDYLIDCLQRNNKVHQNYIDRLSEYKNDVRDYFGPRSFVKGIHLQLCTIDWLYNLDCRIEDFLRKRKKEEKCLKEKEDKEERKNHINNKLEDTKEEKKEEKEERKEKISEIIVERWV